MREYRFALPRRLNPLLPICLTLPLLLSGCGLFGSSHPKPKLGAADAITAAPLSASAQYEAGIEQLRKGNNKKAATDFGAVQVNHPYSTWATHAALLQGYADYQRQDFTAAIASLTRFVQLHPASPEAAYAYYLRALCYYEQIEGVHRDQTTTKEAAQALQDVITRFPNSAYASDARIKLRLAENRLAGHDMVIGRFYERQNLYPAAINSFQKVVQQYQSTTFVPEALERLVECYLDLGLTHEARRTAAVLGYNYPGSSWYQDAYNKLRAHKLLAHAAPPPHQSGGWLFGLF